MLTPLAKDRFFWTLRLPGRPLEETRHRAGWKVARIQASVSVRYQHALKNLRELPPKRRAQSAPTHAFARHLAIGVAIDIYRAVVEDAKLPIKTGTSKLRHGGIPPILITRTRPCQPRA